MAARRFWTAGLLLATLGSGVPIRAQTTTTDSTQSRPTLFEPTDLYWAAGFAAATALMAPLDRVLAHTSQHPQLQASRILNRTAVGARLLGSPGAEVLGTTVWATGRVVGNQHLARVGLHTAESVLIADMITGSVKMIVGRKRPYLSPDNPFDFKLFRGFKGDSVRSFPSGHTTSAFAAAAAATAETGYVWKAGKPYVGASLFTLASLVGMSRMYNNKHWASDVVLGAAIGSFVGWKVVRYTHQHPTNTVDRLLLGRPRNRGGTTTQSRAPSSIFQAGIPITFTIRGP